MGGWQFFVMRRGLGRRPFHLHNLKVHQWEYQECHFGWDLDKKYKHLCRYECNSIARVFPHWMMLQEVKLTDKVANSRTWKLTLNGNYTTTSAYHAQFEAMVTTSMRPVIWNNAPPPIQRIGWPNCGLCQLCRRELRLPLKLYSSVISPFAFGRWFGIGLA